MEKGSGGRKEKLELGMGGSFDRMQILGTKREGVVKLREVEERGSMIRML